MLHIIYMTQLASPSSTLSISLLSYFFADGRFVISGQRINRRQIINGNLESIGCKSGLEICRILSLFCNKTFRVSHHRIVHLAQQSRDKFKNTYTQMIPFS